MNQHLIALDTDWAPEFVIDLVADMLEERGVKATWFVTAGGEGLTRFRDRGDLFEVGLHPDFRQVTQAGRTAQDVMTELKRLIPEAKAVRSHGLWQSSWLLEMMAEQFGVKIDLSILLMGTPHIVPHKRYFQGGSLSLIRIPCFWEDDVEMSSPEADWELKDHRIGLPGLKVWSFHPIHIYLNSSDLSNYERLKEEGPLPHVSERTAVRLISGGQGTRSFFATLLDRVVDEQGKTWTVSELAGAWESGGGDEPDGG